MVNFTVVQVIVVVFLSVAIYNFLELNIQIFTTFKRRTGLYFWSFTISTWGILFNCIGYLLEHLDVTANGNIHATFVLVGWCCMVTGQSVVLYSRLHIIMHNIKRLRAVLIIIVTNAIWLHLPVIILVYGANSSNPTPFLHPYAVYEKIQLSVFIIQELGISSLYLYETTKLLKLEKTIGNNGTRAVLHHLVYVNILVMLFDVSIVILQFVDLYEIQTAWKPLVYSIKLKFEFDILNRLVQLTKNARSGGSRSYSNAIRSGGLALGAMNGKGTNPSSGAQHTDQENQWEVHVDGGEGNKNALPSTVVKTTEVKIQSHSRSMSDASLAESGTEILASSAPHGVQEIEGGSASSMASDAGYGKYANPSWQ